MKVCIVGCGAIGGLLAAFLSRTSADVTVVDRGDQYLAIRDHGLVLVNTMGKKELLKNLRVTDSFENCGNFDVVFLAVKAYEIDALSTGLPALFHDRTALVTLQNGLPWWYFQRCGGSFEGRSIRATDPGGRLSKLIDSQRIVGCVAYPAAEVVEPGVIRHIEGVRFPLGELDGQITPRAKQISELLSEAGLKSPVLEDIRSEIWLKAWGNLAFNPISALTHATMAQIARFPQTNEYAAQLMREAETVANKLGVDFRVSLEQRLLGAEKVGEHKTSMLQDMQALRPMELDAILGTVIEMAALVGVGVPYLKGLYALCSLRDAINMEQAAENFRSSIGETGLSL